jgi:hypothetical protein
LSILIIIADFEYKDLEKTHKNCHESRPLGWESNPGHFKYEAERSPRCVAGMDECQTVRDYLGVVLQREKRWRHALIKLHCRIRDVELDVSYQISCGDVKRVTVFTVTQKGLNPIFLYTLYNSKARNLVCLKF